MARGPSGRLVIEVDPALKRNLHSALAADGFTLKEWFLQHVAKYITDHQQPPLPGIAGAETPSSRAAEDPAPYRASAASTESRFKTQ